ncbi:hypothetical protein [Saccharopolyspora sp. ASAGF58]|uniref:hypothetical protein n=1 Tax=Saccharopolyspora sp. ASAGF58 TaxID=2719023 RepID=UPI00143FE513|nr:hypothetical protein FDZ84_03115 [Saccharopolyspora sp. ASAGF58]
MTALVMFSAAWSGRCRRRWVRGGRRWQCMIRARSWPISRSRSALGGDYASDIAVVRTQPEVFGAVISDPTVSRLIDRLAKGADRALHAIRGAHAAARARVWDRAGTPRQTGTGSAGIWTAP